jgi:hypothetical protein
VDVDQNLVAGRLSHFQTSIRAAARSALPLRTDIVSQTDHVLSYKLRTLFDTSSPWASNLGWTSRPSLFGDRKPSPLACSLFSQ